MLIRLQLFGEPLYDRVERIHGLIYSPGPLCPS
jgi:hypothetical protein